MAFEHENIKRYTALGLIAVLIIFLAIALAQFITVLFGALIVVTLFMPLYSYFLRKNLKPSMSAVLVCIISTIIIAIPFVLLSGLLINEAGQAIQQSGAIAQRIATLDQTFPEYGIAEHVQNAIRGVSASIQNILLDAVNQVTTTLINLIVLYFLVYFMLIYNKEAKRGLMKYMPFNRKNTNKLIEAFGRITHATILGAGLVALAQGFILGVGLSIVGVPNPVLLGFVGAIISFLPVVGIALIWIPVALLQLLNGDIWGFIGVLITGGVISVLDYTLRPQFQQKKGQIHPLISILGVIIGIQYFGIFGIVVGPLLLSYAISTIDMFIEEYVTKD